MLNLFMVSLGRHALILALLTLPWLTACGRFAVSERIGEQARSDSVVDIAKVADFAWTEVRIYTPYSTRRAVCNDFGELAPSCLDEAPANAPEGGYLLVFIDQGRAVRYLPHDRRNGNLQSNAGVLTLQ